MESNQQDNEEIWKKVNIKEYEKYKISNLGNIKGIKKFFLKQTLKLDGYMKVQLSKNNKGTEYLVHRLVAITFIPIPDKYKDYKISDLVVNHKNLDKTDNKIENLEWNTYSENSQHYVNHEDTKLGKSLSITYNGKTKIYHSVVNASEKTKLTVKQIYYRCNSKNYPGYFYINNNIDNSIKEDGINIVKLSNYNNYLITKDGKIYSTFHTNTRLLSVYKSGEYDCIVLWKDGKKIHERINRLVMMTFSPCKNMDKLVVNHKDLNKSNNNLDNLEWFTYSENSKHAFNNKQIHQHSVIKYDLKRNKLKEYNSIQEANYDTFGKDKNRYSQIVDVCQGRKFRVGKYIFTYKENEGKFFEKPKKVSVSTPILQYNIDNKFIKEYIGSRELCIELYEEFTKSKATYINIICKENSDKISNFKLLEGYIFKYKELPKRYITRYDLELNFIKLYNDAEEANKDLNGDKATRNTRSLILTVCNGKQKSTKDNIFKFIYEGSDEYNELVNTQIKV